MNNKLIAVIVVVILVVSGAVAAIVHTQNHSSSKQTIYDIDGGLEVYGNADGDYKIDNADVQIIKDIIAGTKTLVSYPYADANYDGTVDSDDVTLVEKIINKESCTVWHVNTCSTGNYVVSTQWPITSAISTGSSNMLLLLTMAGVKDDIHGITYTSSSVPDATLFPTFSKMTSLGSSSTAISIDAASDTIKQYNVTALISDYTASTISNESEFEAAGIDVIRVDPAYVDVDAYSSQLLLIGFLFQTETQCLEIAQWETAVMKQIDEKLATVTAKVSAITTNGSTAKGAWVSGGISDYKDVITTAGATYAIPDAVVKGISGYASGAYFSSSDTWLYNYEFDYIVSIRTGGWYSGMDSSTMVQKYNSTMEYLTNTEAYENGNAYVIVGDGPIIIRIAYAATVLYPSLFTEDWANQLNQEFFEKFYDEASGSTVDFTNLYFVISKAMVDKASSA